MRSVLIHMGRSPEGGATVRTPLDARAGRFLSLISTVVDPNGPLTSRNPPRGEPRCTVDGEPRPSAREP